MLSSILLLMANAAVLIVGTPAESAPRFKCPSLAAVGGTETPSIRVGIFQIPTVAIGGTDTGTNNVLVCCKSPAAGVEGIPDAECLDGG